jgi:hypothetical protein
MSVLNRATTLGLGTREATIVGVTFFLNDEEWIGEGTSKRNPVDNDSEEIANLLAYGRAFEQLGQRMLKRANGLIKHEDDMRAYKEMQKARSETHANKKKRREVEVKRVQGRKVVKETRCFS